MFAASLEVIIITDFIADTAVVVGIIVAVGAVALMLREVWKTARRE